MPRRRGRVGTELEIRGPTIPVRVRRPNLNVTRETGTTVRLRERAGGTTELHVTTGEEPAGPGLRRDVRDTNYWAQLSEQQRLSDREYWENMVPEAERIRDQRYWDTVDWRERHIDPRHIQFESQRAGRERAELARTSGEERLAALRRQAEKLEAEMRKPWTQRERNKGLNIIWRPIFLAMDIASLPFWLGSKLVGGLARPASWINDRLLGTPSYRELSKTRGGARRTILNKGTTRADFLPSLFRERRELARVRRQMRQVESEGH